MLRSALCGAKGLTVAAALQQPAPPPSAVQRHRELPPDDIDARLARFTTLTVEQRGTMLTAFLTLSLSQQQRILPSFVTAILGVDLATAKQLCDQWKRAGLLEPIEEVV